MRGEFSTLRTELFQLLVIPSLAHHPVHPNAEFAGHRDLVDLPSPSHRQVAILTPPFREAAHRHLRRFHLAVETLPKHAFLTLEFGIDQLASDFKSHTIAQPTADIVTRFRNKLSSAENFDAIRNLEASAAASYFREW